MKAKEYKGIIDYIEKKEELEDLKGVVICKAKKCENFLYQNSSSSKPEYCQDCC